LERSFHKSKEEDEGVLTKVKTEAEIDEKAEPELGARARVTGGDGELVSASWNGKGARKGGG
jgi:hypothetical protein